jgi:hypothetical protein
MRELIKAFQMLGSWNSFAYHDHVKPVQPPPKRDALNEVIIRTATGRYSRTKTAYVRYRLQKGRGILLPHRA